MSSHAKADVRSGHSTVVAADELFLCVVEAASEELIRLAYDRASALLISRRTPSSRERRRFV